MTMMMARWQLGRNQGDIGAPEAPPEGLPEEVQQALDHFVQMNPRDFAMVLATLERTAK